MDRDQIEAIKKELDEELSLFEEKRKLRDAFALVLTELSRRKLRDSSSSEEFGSEGSHLLDELEMDSTEYGSIVAKVRMALAGINRMAFTFHDVAKYWNDRRSPIGNQQISSVLVRLKNRGELEVSYQGSGSVPTLYRKKEGPGISI